MKLSWQMMLPLCLSVYLSHSTITFAAGSPSFSSAEHVAIGNNINLYFDSDDPGHMATPLHMPNGLNLTYGDIVSLGDFYELVNQPISQGQSEAERRSRFLAAFSSFSLNTNAPTETTQILNVIYNEQKLLDDGIKRGEKPEDIYKSIGHENDRQFNCITGGGCSPSTWWLEPGRYLNLANMDYDHFGEHAWISYSTGHQLALEQAVVAHQTGDLKKLEMAYAMNAFACHFLTDRFSAGHIRTPRVELSEQITPGTVGSLLSSYMHGEENVNGLHVHNLNGDKWIAYGDKSYFSPQTSYHRNMIIATMQNSADQIFAAYQQGTTQVNDNVKDFIPLPDETGNAANLDISPLFYWDDTTKKLMRRSDMQNLNDRHWTDNWWGWSTLLELQKERGLSDEAQATLVLTSLKFEYNYVS